jgi:tRNA-dihydrouridine synthase
VKTRIGLESASRAAALLEIYNRYPIAELTVHPRTQRDLYGGKPDLETFSLFLQESVHPVIYNGDIFSLSDYEKICARFPECRAVMIGRGLIANPALARELKGGAPLQIEELRLFHDAVYESLRKTLPGQAPLLGKMKELWFYMGRNFTGADRCLKEIKKAKNEIQYRAAVRTLFLRAFGN